MNRKLNEILKNKKGESLVETIISITLFAIYSATIFGIITVSININEQTAKDSEYFQENILSVAEQQAYSDDGGAVTFTIKESGGAPVTTSVEPIQMLGEEGEGYVAFKPIPAPTGGMSYDAE